LMHIPFLLARRRPMFALFPYTTLFRSRTCPLVERCAASGVRGGERAERGAGCRLLSSARVLARSVKKSAWPSVGFPARSRIRCRSEEHTSELQSRENLVCRLLLEKKKY